MLLYCKMVADGQAVADEERPGRPVVSMTSATIAAVNFLIIV